MNPQTPSPAESSPSQPLRPGAYLREQRRAKGETVENVAKELLFSVSQVRQLEADEYAKLPHYAYLYGYWKSYATYLGCSVDESIAAYRHEWGVRVRHQTVEPRNEVAEQAAAAPSQRSTVLVSLALLMVFLGVAWYLQQLPSRTPTQAQNANPTESVTTLPATTAASPSPIQHPQTRQIVFDVREKSWLEVYDAKRNQLLRQQAQPGDSLQVTGRAPFSVFIGNARGVVTTFEGESFARTPQNGGAYARFKLDAR